MSVNPHSVMVGVGPGKYDDLCTLVRQAVSAQGAIVIIVKGTRGNGFSVQADPQLTAGLPQMLRLMADGMEKTAGRVNEALKKAGGE